MLTPQEVSDKMFPKTSSFTSGYQMAAVDEFLDALTEDYGALYKENAALKAKMKLLAEKVEEYRATEDAMRSTLLAAQKMAATMVQEAEGKRASLLATAEADAAARIAELNGQTRQAENKLAIVQEGLSAFLAESARLCEEQAAFLRSFAQAQLPQQEEQAAQTEDEQVVESVVAHIEQEAAPAVQSADEVRDMEINDADIRQSLGELKFGRNYSEE